MSYWGGFDPTPYTANAWTAHVNAIPLAKLRWCKFITLHNTSSPTLSQWVELGPAHDARLRNLRDYYANHLGWHQGPHGFISRSHINGFSSLTEPGIHASCFNASSIGLEQVGEFNVEPYNSGDGAMVRDMAVHAVAVLCNRIGLRPDHYIYGISGLHFHIECRHDNHDCPGTFARNKAELVQRILARMVVLDGSPPLSAPVPHSIANGRQVNITMTEFAGTTDSISDRTDGYTGQLIDVTKPGVALPFEFPVPLPRVRLFYRNKTIVADVVDVGPHSTNNPYWLDASRPLAERQKLCNGAGIDATPAVFNAFGVLGDQNTRTIVVDWQFE
jgi:N-acetylmuramoyl-L-alanine amidase